MRINFMSPLRGRSTKEFTYVPAEKIWKLTKGYQAGKFFEGKSFDVADIEEAFEVIKKAQERNAFLIPGEFTDPHKLKKIVRRKIDKKDGLGVSIKDRKTRFICFDVDNYDCEYSGTDAIEYFIAEEMPVEFMSADYIFQFSASYELLPGGLKCHLFFVLEKPASLPALREWAIAYNTARQKGKIIDPAVFVATQPIYTQRRICRGAPDPVTEFCGMVKKEGELAWSPPTLATAGSDDPQTFNPRTFAKSKFSFQESAAKIFSGESFHNEILPIALSLTHQGLPAARVKELLKAMMLAAKDNIKDSNRLLIWQTRFDDIDRSVDGCFAIVNNPPQDDLLTWLKTALKKDVIKNFPGKCFKKDSHELTEIIDIIVERTGLKKKDIKSRLRKFNDDQVKTEKERKQKELKKDNIYQVVVNKHNLIDAAAQCAAIFRQSSRWPPVFVQEGGLVYIEYSKKITIRQMAKEKEYKTRRKSRPKTAKIVPFEKPYHDLIGRAGMDIHFVKSAGGDEIDCPERLASVLAIGNDPGHRELTGILECPYVKSDWKLFNQKGYDPATGLYSVVDPDIKYPQMPAKEAYQYMTEEVLAEFPFNDDLDKAVAVSAFLALIQRPLLATDEGGMPGVLFTAPVPASGKTAVAHLIINAILNRSVPVSNFSSDEEELGKHILSLLREGNPCVLFDNIEQGTSIKSESLAKAMSGDFYSNRLLGANKTLAVPSSAIWFFTGNNITPGDDFHSRLYSAVLNPLMEDPDTRIFSRENILDWVVDNRIEIITALLSILRAGKNEDPLTTGSRFKVWDKYVRAPLYWAGGIDINESIAVNKSSDQDTVLKKRLVRLVYEKFFEGKGENQLITTRDIINEACYDNETTVLGEALEDILSKKYADNAKSLGRLLSKMVGRAWGNLILSREEKDRAFWKIEPLPVREDPE